MRVLQSRSQQRFFQLNFEFMLCDAASDRASRDAQGFGGMGSVEVAAHHRTHLRVTCQYLKAHGFDEALGRLRSGIQAYNQIHRVPNELNSGYHETLTVAWLHLVDAEMTLNRSSRTDSNASLDEHPELLDKKTLHNFYTRERMLTMEAKATFVPPDLHPLPEPSQGVRPPEPIDT